MKKHYIAYGMVVMVLVGIAGWQASQIERLSRTVGELEGRVTGLNTQVAAVGEQASSTAAAQNASELVRRQQVVQKSEGQRLEDAVAAVTPAVVSIVKSQEVALLEVEYVNPFGDDPFFRNFGFQVPVYRQVGTTTERVSAGTGFIVRANGYIVTNKHVVTDESATYTVLLASGKKLPGTVIWRSPDKDIAVVKIAGIGYVRVPLGDSSTLRLGETVFAVGNALGEYSNSVSVGIISGLNRSITATARGGSLITLENVIQTDAAINPGNSGGPLVNLAGQAVGVSVATVQGSQSIGFALPISEVRRVLADLGI